MANGSEDHDRLDKIGQFGWGGFGGLIPLLIQLVRPALVGGIDVTATLPPHVGGGFIVAVVIAVVLGGVASRAFRAHHLLAALYHGATAPITLAFVIGLNTHATSPL